MQTLKLQNNIFNFLLIYIKTNFKPSLKLRSLDCKKIKIKWNKKWQTLQQKLYKRVYNTCKQCCAFKSSVAKDVFKIYSTKLTWILYFEWRCMVWLVVNQMFDCAAFDTSRLDEDTSVALQFRCDITWFLNSTIQGLAWFIYL